VTWTIDLVLVRLIEAFAIIEATTGRATPGAYGPTLPGEMVLDDDDRYGGKMLDDDMKWLKEQRMKKIEKQSSTISLAEEAQDWPIDFVNNPLHRLCLIDYATVRSRDGDWSEWLKRRHRKFKGNFASLRRKTYRWRDAALQEIADALNSKGALLRMSQHCDMSHISRMNDSHQDPPYPLYFRSEKPRLDPRSPRVYVIKPARKPKKKKRRRRAK